MPATIYHAYTNTVADGTATSVVRPSDWNSVHNITLSPSGQEIIGAFSNAGNVTFGTNTAGYVTATANAGGGGDGYNIIAAGGSTAATTGTIVFSNSNGVSFGLNGATVTAAHNGLTTAAQSNHSHDFATTTTNGASIVVGTKNSSGVTIGVPSFLTTARASNDAIGLNTALTANGLSVTANSSGLSINVPAWLTTAAQSNHSHGNPTLALTNITGTTASASNGLTLSLSGVAAQTTQTQPAGNIAGVGTTFNGTNVSGSMTLNTNGLRLDLSAGAGGAGDGYNIIGVNGGGTALSTTLQLSNSNNVTFGLNAGTITASASFAQTVQPVAYSAANGSANFSTLTFANSNGVSFSTGTQGVFATVATTYAASNHSHGNPTLALTNITGTTASASNGLTLSLSGVAAQTTQTQPAGNIAGVGTTFAGANVSGSMTLNSNGLNLSLSAPTPGGGGAINVSAGTTSGNLQTIQFDNGNGVTFGLNGSTVTASVNAGGGGATESNYFPHKDALWAAAQVGQNRIQVQPVCNAPTMSYDRLAYGIQFTQATNSTMTVSCTVYMGIYTKNGSTLSQLTSGSGSFSINGSGTASSSANSGPRWATMTLNAGGSISGDVWFAFKSSTATAGVNATLSNLVASRINSTWSGIIGVGTAASVQSLPGMGFYSATSSALPNSMAFSHITGNSSTAQRPQIFWLTNGALP